MRRKRDMSLNRTVREYIVAHPKATTEDIVDATGCTKQQVYAAKTALKASGLLPTADAVIEPDSSPPVMEPLFLDINIPPSGLRLKVRGVGILDITGNGFSFTADSR